MKHHKAFASSLKIIWLILAQILDTTGKNITSRIAGGHEIDIYQAKFVVQIVSKHQGYKYAMCGGSLVTPYHIVTAAHCVEDVQIFDITVIGGATYFWKGGYRRAVRAVYTPSNPLWDIAVLRLRTALRGPNIETIQLCNTEWQVGDLLNVYGWGDTLEKDVILPYSGRMLREVAVPVVGHKECSLFYNRVIPEYYICAGVPYEKDALCGDSGGPAVLNNQLCGVVSCGTLHPGIGLYVDINHVKTFLETHIKL